MTVAMRVQLEIVLSSVDTGIRILQRDGGPDLGLLVAVHGEEFFPKVLGSDEVVCLYHWLWSIRKTSQHQLQTWP